MNITETLSNLQKGKLLVEAQEAMQDVVKAVQATGKKGKITISLDIVANGQTVLVLGEVTPKIPKPTKNANTFYPDEHGGLHREDPNQGEFEEVAKVAAKQ